MNDQLLCGVALGAAGIAAIAAGVPWLGTAALVAALPFLAIGSLFVLGASRARHDRAPGPIG
jgi:hypothetical protein